jgi:hypothetical protein
MIVSRKKLYLTGALLFCLSGAIQADVPYVFQEGDTIRADEINDNFRHLNSEVVTLADEVESSSSSIGSSENYTYNQKNLNVGRDRLSVLGSRYDIAQIETLSFKDHSLFTLKFPALRNYSNFPLRAELLDIHGLGLARTSELRGGSWGDSSETISGYPARVSVSVTQMHAAATMNGGEVTEEEFDAIEWGRHDFYWSTNDEGVYNQLRIDVTGSHPNPNYEGEYWEVYRRTCNLEYPRGDFPYSILWNAVTNVAYSSFYGNENYVLSDLDVRSDLATVIADCLAADKAERQFKWRTNRYNTYMSIGVSAQVLLDDATVTSFYFSFDEALYEADLRTTCSSYPSDSAERWNCGAEYAKEERNFSGLIDQQSTLARTLRREEYVQELFTLFDHIVISKTAEN